MNGEQASASGAPSPLELTRAICIAASVGIVVGMIIAKIYSIFLHYLFGKGHLQGHSEARYESVWIDSTQGKIRVVRRGQGENRPLVMLVHGYAGSLDVYADPSRSNLLQRIVDEGFEVIAFDLFGHGGSDCPDTGFSAELFASQIAEICLTLEIHEPFNIVAHSMGSSVAVTFAHKYPSLVSKLVLISPSIADCPMELRLRLALRIPFFREVLSYFIIPTFGEGTNDNNAGMLRACYRLLETRLRSGGSWNEGTLTGQQMLCEIAKTKFKTKRDLFIMWGVTDTVVKFKEAKVLATATPEAGFYVMKEADHMSFADGLMEMREIFASRILGFLKGDVSLITSTMHSHFIEDATGVDNGHSYQSFVDLV